jgi:carboxymethylenebutenolidase
VTVETLDVTTTDGVADAYRAGDGPGVLFIMDAIGLRPRIAEMVERIAEGGYTVLAPNIFYRSGRAPVLELPDFSDPAHRAEFMGLVRPLIAQVDAAAIVRDAGAYLEQLPPGPVAITGYCMGARLGLRIAAAFPDRVVALAGFHGGMLVTDRDDSPHLSLGKVHAEVYIGHADEDPSMSAEAIAELDRALAATGVRHTTEVYAGARHGYTMSDTAVYDEAACERHFAALFDLLDRNL